MRDNFSYHVPVKVVFGPGRLDETGIYAQRFGRKALIVTTGPFFTQNGFVKRLQRVLGLNGVASEVFTDISPNPQAEEVDEGARFARDNGCDMVVGLGGGSAMDAAKAIAIAAGHNDEIWKFVKQQLPITDKTLPIIAITTTSGTGSQVTPFFVISNPDIKEKPGMGSEHTWAKVAIVDPELMISLPRKVTAATGFDVFAHAIEAYVSTNATPVTDMYAEEAMRLVGRYLRKAVEDGDDMEARTAMAWADTMAGHALSLADVTIAHALSHGCGGECNAVHGEALAALTPHTMRFSMMHNPAKFKNIAMFLRDEYCCDENSGVAEKMEDGVKEVEKLVTDIGLSPRLSELGIKESDLQNIADGTMRYMLHAVKFDVRPAAKEELVGILRNAF